MKNLVAHKVCRRHLDFLSKAGMCHEISKGIQCAINPSYNDMHLLLGEHLYTISHGKSDIVCRDVGYFSKVIAMEYCVTLQELYCAFESGHIVKLDIKSDQTRVDQKLEMMFVNGLQCMKFSPDHELIAAVTSAGIVVTMVLDFQIMSEVDVNSDEFGQNKSVNVGWGKKETQFHGLMGKAAAQVKSDQLIPNENDDGHTRIVWREDGAFFAVSFLHKETKIRKFKVFNREGILCYTSQQINGLEKNIAWCPSGEQIGVTQILNDKYFVTFFEKNGLKYSELLLPFKPQEVKVKDLLWSSDILVVVYHQIKTSTTMIQLWTESNCHWYLKQTLAFPVENQLLYVAWSNLIDQPNKKELVYLTSKDLVFCSFNWCVNHSRGIVDDKAICGVIDGSKVLVTAIKDGIVPPPLAHESLETYELQNAIIFSPNITNKSALINSNEFCTFSYNNKLTFFRQIKDVPLLTYAITHSCSINFDILRNIKYEVLPITEEEIQGYMRHFLWFTEDIMLFSVAKDERNLLCILSLNDMFSKDYLIVQEIHVLSHTIEHIVSSSDGNTAYIKTGEQIFKYTLDGKLEKTNITLNKSCEQIEVVKIYTKDVILARSHENGFLIEGKEIAKNITSFYVHSDFVLLTTLQNTLICVSLNEIGMQQLSKHDLTVKPWLHDMKEILFTDIYIRRIEKDSRIIVAVPHESKLILQVPRGNLETIQPRALSLHILKCYLSNCNYLAALDMMTKQRINLNLIYDHNPQLFRYNVEKFVGDIVRHKKVNWLNLFLSELQNEDVTKTMYAYCYSDRIVESDAKSNKIDKIDEVSKLLRDVMESRQDADYLVQPILISWAKNQQKQGLENALNNIKKMKLLEGQKLAHGSTVSASEALKYLLHFVSIDTLYDVALGMYDIELAMFIASKSSKDPKEYIPFLNNLNKLNQNYMKYSIDMYLKRYESALEHLSKEPTKFVACLNLICSHKLYKKAMKLFEKNTIEHRRVAEAYGEFLSNEKKYSEAGMMFYRSGNLNRASQMFSMSGDNWEDVIAILKEMRLGPTDLYKHYVALIKHLKTEQKYKPAAIILKEYLNDVEEAVALLCEGRFWKYAIRTVIDVQRLDLNETHIKPGVQQHAEHVISQLSNMKEDFLKYKLRLSIVRIEIKAKQAQLFDKKKTYDNEPEVKEVLDSISDTISVASTSNQSQMSLSSSKSYRSSKNRRKQERKFFSLKEGSMFEDLSLIYALYQIVSNAYKDRDDWYQLVQVLMRFEFDKSAEKILVEARKFFELIESSKSEIWDRSAPASLTDMEKCENYTQPQFQEMIAPIKSIERCIMYPPEKETSYELTIF